MSAPAEFKNYQNPTAKYTMNTKLSDASDDILAAQGVGYLKRKAIGMTTVSIVNSSKIVDGILELTSISSASGIPGATEITRLDGQPKKNDHSVYGKIITIAQPVKPEEIPEEYLKTGWLPESYDDEGKLLYIKSQSDKDAGNKYDWHAALTTGFQDIDVGGKVEKRFCRLNVFEDKKGFKKSIRLVYDYVGPA